MRSFPASVGARPARQDGFTLIELVVVMGILAGFLTMLVRFLDTGVRLFDEGEKGQNAADRSQSGQRLVEAQLRSLRGPGLQIEPGAVSARFLVQMLPLGLPARAAGEARLPFVRASVHLDADVEAPLRDALVRRRAANDVGADSGAAFEERMALLRGAEPLRGVGSLLLFVSPKEPEHGLLQLRIAHLLPGQAIPIDRDRDQDPMAVVLPGSAELPAAALLAATRVLVDDVLHLELQMWSQRTRGWSGSGQGGGAEIVWDSARAGWLQDEAFGPVFALDRGPDSAFDPTDDVFPHALRVLLVVADDEKQAAAGLLADELQPEDRSLRLVAGDRFPGPSDGGFVKLGGEWIRYGARDGDWLTGLQRGVRGTKARSHPAATRVRTGRPAEFTVPLAHGKDDWNG